MMTLSLRVSTIALTIMVCSVPLFAGSAMAKSNFLQDCSKAYKAGKADGSVDAATKWTDYMKNVCKPGMAAAADATAPVAKPVKMTAAEKKAAASTEAAPMDAKTTPSGSFTQNCSAAWKDMKAKNTVPEGMTWKAFLASKCVTPAATTAEATPSKAKTTLSPTFIQQCGDDWKAMKIAGTVPPGLTWKDFVIGKCKATPASATTAEATAPAAAGSFMENCSSEWKAMKAAGTVPESLAWKDFIKAKCVVAGQPAKATKAMVSKKPAATTPDEPTDTSIQKPLATVDKNGKQFTPAQMAVHLRAHNCGLKYREAKANNTMSPEILALPPRNRWPQFWSACNKEMKAAGL